MQSRIVVVATLRVEGFHRWPNAPDEVDFLRERHRHEFHIRVEREVEHDDRDVEIIMLKNAVRKHLHRLYGDPMFLGVMSCEMLARGLVDNFGLFACEVLEDGENGAKVYA